MKLPAHAPDPNHVIVAAGSRYCTDWSLVTGALTVLHRMFPHAVLLTGDAPGADIMFAAEWAQLRGYDTITEAETDGVLIIYRAAWDDPCRPDCTPGHRRRIEGQMICPAAGPYRNQRMCSEAATAGLPVTTITIRKEGAAARGTSDCIAAMLRNRLPHPITLTEEAGH